MIAAMTPLRILCLANVPMDRNAGAAGAELETILALRELGHEVEDVWADTVGRRIGHGNLHQLLELPFRYEQIVRERMEGRPFDVVHVNQPHGYRAARLVQQRWPASVFIHRSHGFEPRVEEVLAHWRSVYAADDRTPWRRAAASVVRRLLARHSREITRWADGHILCSRQDADFMVERYGVSRERAAVLPQAPPDAFLEPPASFTAERLRTVLYVGQYVFFKAPMIVAASMNAIAREEPAARFIWVASPEHHDLIRAALSAEVRERIDVRPWMAQSELRNVYDSAGVFLFPSFFEGSGKVHLEALSRGLCVVTTNIAGMRDTIESGRTGILVEPGDAEAVAAGALSLMRDPAAATEMSRAAASRAREMSWHRTAVETAAFYQRMIDLKRTRG